MLLTVGMALVLSEDSTAVKDGRSVVVGEVLWGSGGVFWKEFEFLRMPLWWIISGFSAGLV